jgi:hypothetical protein
LEIEKFNRAVKDFSTQRNAKEAMMKNEKDVVIVKVTLKYLSALRKEVGRHMDPETAEVLWDIGQIMDPYGDEGPNLPKELQQGGDNYFVRSPGSDLWICFTDLPEATVKYLWANQKFQKAEEEGMRSRRWKPTSHFDVRHRREDVKQKE